MKYEKVALIFPGQGSQYVGMGKEFYDRFKLVRDIYDEAGSVMGYDIAEKCFKKPIPGAAIIHKPDLDRTIYTQPAVMVTGYACYRIFEEMCKEVGVHPNVRFLAGHSLGEYTALLVAGAMDFRTCADLVNKRATCITEFSESYPHAALMAIVNKGGDLDHGRIETLTKEAQVHIALNNTKNQLVVGGFKKNLEELSKTLKKENLFSTVLKVEGTFPHPSDEACRRPVQKGPRSKSDLHRPTSRSSPMSLPKPSLTPFTFAKSSTSRFTPVWIGAVARKEWLKTGPTFSLKSAPRKS